MGNILTLEEIYLSNNRLTGDIPPEFGELANLKILVLGGNALSGNIPSDITDLTGLTTLYLGYNKLTTNSSEVFNFVNEKSPAWFTTQTTPPFNLQGEVLSSTSIRLTWQPIPYTSNGGYYEISYATYPLGPFFVHGRTVSKNVASYNLNNLLPNTTYYFRVRTFTPAHDFQQNALWSNYTPLIFADTLPPPISVAVPPVDACGIMTTNPRIIQFAGRQWYVKRGIGGLVQMQAS